jgi:hypothetical protein
VGKIKAFDRRLTQKLPCDTEAQIDELTLFRDRLKRRLIAEKKIPPEKRPDGPPVDPEELKRVREILRRSRVAPPELVKQGPALNPIYLAILTDEKSKWGEIRGALFVLEEQKGDRTEFTWAVGNLLSHSQSEIREYAAKLLGKTGGPEDAWLLVPLLQDENAGVQYAAGPAIAKLGGSYELKMLDLRLKTKHSADTPDLLAELTKDRDQLKARLGARNKPKK